MKKLNTGTDEQNRDAFEEWFYKLLFSEGMTCLLRDVLRKNRAALLETWLEVKPWTFEESQTTKLKGPTTQQLLLELCSIRSKEAQNEE